MLIAAIVVAVVIGALANIYRNGERQRRAVTNLGNRGWIIKYDVDVDSTFTTSAKKWLALFVGKDNVCCVHTISAINDTVPTDDDVSAVSELRSLRAVYVLSWQSSISDDGVCALSQVQTLECLVIHNTVMSDFGLECLCESPRLKVLTFDEFKEFTDETVSILSRYQSLEELNVSDRGLSKDDVMQIQKEVLIAKLRIWSSGK